jgi:hypothetical protein
MKKVKDTLRVVVALAVIVAAAYWAINSARSDTYGGTELEFTMGGGQVIVNNMSDEPVLANLEARGSSSAFTVTSSNADLSVRSTREGTGVNAVNKAQIELPPGESDLRLTRGNNVTFTAQSEDRLEAKVARVSSGTLRLILVVSLVLILGALYFISATFGHPWKAWLRNRQLGRGAGRVEKKSSA